MKLVWRGCILLTAGILIFLAFRITAFVQIFFEHAGFALSQDEVAGAYANDTDHARTAVVPRIIHQIFHNWTDPSDEKLPEDWIANRQTCIDLNEGWEHKLWTASLSRSFIEENYAWFLPTYEGFQFPVQRVDALRYFLMRHFGGIYIDLDNSCIASLEPLRYYPAWLTDGGRGALSNNILGAEPHHPYWILLTDSIIPYAWNYPLPYMTIMSATGQWFLTVMWEKYHARKSQADPSLLRVKMDMAEGADRWVFFTQERGGTWNNWDNMMFKWIGDHLVAVVLMGVGAVGFVVGIGVLMVRALKRRARKKRGYALVESTNEGEE